MAAFATFALAEARAVAKVADGTWIEAHAALGTLQNSGSPQFVVRVIRKMTSALTQGAWVEINDNAQT